MHEPDQKLSIYGRRETKNRPALERGTHKTRTGGGKIQHRMAHTSQRSKNEAKRDQENRNLDNARWDDPAVEPIGPTH
jgi:hypothetical protein